MGANVAVMRLAAVLRRAVDAPATVGAQASTVRDLIVAVDAQYPGLHARIVDTEGMLYRYVSVFVDDEDVRGLDGLDTPVGADTVVTVLPAIAGGS